MSKRELQVGMIGYSFMGKAHSFGYKNLQLFYNPDVLPTPHVLCGRNQDALKEAAKRYGWPLISTDWQAVVNDPSLDIIDISAPGEVHAKIAIAAAQAGKIVFCEKPLANNLAEAKAMYEAVKIADVKHMINFNYRRCPAVALAKRLIEEGLLGDIYSFLGLYLQDWIIDPNFPAVWRLTTPGGGPRGDLAAHSVDLARYLVGEITSVTAQEKTFITERPAPPTTKGEGLAVISSSTEMVKVNVEDASMFLVKFTNGAQGVFVATRLAPGRKNHNQFEIHGSKGSISFCFEDMNRLMFYSLEDPKYLRGWRDIMLVDDGTNAWWPEGHPIGYGELFIMQMKELSDAIDKDRMPSPNFADGVQCNAVLHAIGESAKSGQWENVEQIV